jgi:receptor-type tyrosine-protein phosphatase Q
VGCFRVKSQPSQAKIDLVFVMDASGSIGSTGYRQCTTFAKDVVASFDVGSDQTRVGSVTYASGVRPDFYLNANYNGPTVQNMLANLRYTGGGTATYAGLDMAAKYFSSTAYGSRPSSEGVPRTVVVITDGVSNSRTATLAAAQRLKDNGVSIFAIGLGRYLNMVEINGMASAPISTNAFVLSQVSDISGFVDRMSSYVAQCMIRVYARGFKRSWNAFETVRLSE